MIIISTRSDIQIDRKEKDFLKSEFKKKGCSMDGKKTGWTGIADEINQFLQSLSTAKNFGDNPKPFNFNGKNLSDIFGNKVLEISTTHRSPMIDYIYVFLFKQNRLQYYSNHLSTASELGLSSIILDIREETECDCQECKALSNPKFANISSELKNFIMKLKKDGIWQESFFYAHKELIKINEAINKKEFLISEREYSMYIEFFFENVLKFMIGTSVPEYFQTWTEKCTYGERLIELNEILITQKKGRVIRFFISNSAKQELTEEEKKVFELQKSKGIELYVAFLTDFEKLGIPINEYDFTIFDGKAINRTQFLRDFSQKPLKYSCFEANRDVLQFFTDKLKPLILRANDPIGLFLFNKNNELIRLSINERKFLLNELTELIINNR